MTDLETSAEREARRAESLPAFGSLNLRHLKDQVAKLLDLIGREGVFDEYTVHNISHIDAMLRSLDWIIPDETKKVMSPADWLMSVLAIFFHDLGMLVTRREYDARESSGFPSFRDEVLFAGPGGQDYRAKVELLGVDRAERFLYQEFVRNKHAERIRAWITGKLTDQLGISDDAVGEISKLMDPLGPQFRRDLGLVCESHHLNDLADLKKYRPSQPYGNSNEETANVQYAAVLLRTADLLHITSDRTPSVVFRTINPVDPVSQAEWAKQMAVTRVRPKVAMNEDGELDEKAPRDTVEVHAYFTNEDGFFGLTSYLGYAEQQLRASHDWVSATTRKKLAPHTFPWRKIDDTNIETEGFLRDTFEFTIDQAKILDLLTGHTLYNDVGVVVRELVQNSLDAVRLQHGARASADSGNVEVAWDSKGRLLSVLDNGTGMTQEIISKFLLKVGNSRYQDPEFKKEHPDFSSISRFGIGVLSAFMVADNVEVTTCHPDEPQARRLTLRSVHGKYLIRLVEKSDNDVQRIVPHGTQLKLKVRPSVEIDDITSTTAKWIVIPQCNLSVIVDGRAPTRIGAATPGEALRDALRDVGVHADYSPNASDMGSESGGRGLRIIQKRSGAVTLAVGVKWNEYFREWEFATTRSIGTRRERRLVVGTCVEGVRVEFETPGFDGDEILALANVEGPQAPKTNVARSGLEGTPERDAMLAGVYSLLAGHVADEKRRLHAERGFSLTWATREARFLVATLLAGSSERRFRPCSEFLFDRAIRELPVLLIEDGSRRTSISPNELAKKEHFWTVDCGLFNSGEPLIREAATTASLNDLIRALNVPGSQFPEGIVLCGIRTPDMFASYAFSSHDVDRIVVLEQQRRVDLRWAVADGERRWVKPPDELLETLHRYVQVRRGLFPREILIAVRPIEVVASGTWTAIDACGTIFFLSESPVAEFARDCIDRFERDGSIENRLAGSFALAALCYCRGARGRLGDPDVFLSQLMRGFHGDGESNLGGRRLEQAIRYTEALDAVANTDWAVFRPSDWEREGFASDYMEVF